MFMHTSDICRKFVGSLADDGVDQESFLIPSPCQIYTLSSQVCLISCSRRAPSLPKLFQPTISWIPFGILSIPKRFRIISKNPWILWANDSSISTNKYKHTIFCNTSKHKQFGGSTNKLACKPPKKLSLQVSK